MCLSCSLSSDGICSSTSAGAEKPDVSCDTSLLSRAVPEEGITSSGTISTNVSRLSDIGTFTEATRIQLLAVVDEALKTPALPVMYQPWHGADLGSLARLMLPQPVPGYNLAKRAAILLPTQRYR